MSHLVAVTGAEGFIGSKVRSKLISSKRAVRSFVRRLEYSWNSEYPDNTITLVEINASTHWRAALTGVDCVVHCAARAHVMDETAANPLAVYREVNVEGTRRLALHAADAGVRRLVFLSSIGVLGRHTNGRGPFSTADSPSPFNDYTVSKWEAEQALWRISNITGLEVVVVRSPLVYGSGVKGNLARLVELLRKDLRLPFGAVQNKRAFIGLDNLVDLLIRCVDHPTAAGQTFLVSDGEDLSTPDVLHNIAAAMGHSARLIPVPVPLLRLAGSVIGKRGEIDRLVDSLEIDSSRTRRVLGWTPTVGVQDGMRRMVQGS